MAQADRIDTLLAELDAIRRRLEEISAELRLLRVQAAAGATPVSDAAARAGGAAAGPQPSGQPIPSSMSVPGASDARRRLASLLDDEAPQATSGAGPQASSGSSASQASPDALAAGHATSPASGAAGAASGAPVSGPSAGTPEPLAGPGDPVAGAPGEETGLFLDALDLSEDFRKILSSVIRSGKATAADIARDTGEEEMAVKIFLKTLLTQGYVSRESGPEGAFLYRAVIRRKAKSLTRTGADILRRLEDLPPR